MLAKMAFTWLMLAPFDLTKSSLSHPSTSKLSTANVANAANNPYKTVSTVDANDAPDASIICTIDADAILRFHDDVACNDAVRACVRKNYLPQMISVYFCKKIQK